MLNSDLILYLGKPQDVSVPISIDAPGVVTREQIIGLAARSPASSMFAHEF